MQKSERVQSVTLSKLKYKRNQPIVILNFAYISFILGNLFHLSYEEKDFIKDSYTGRHVAKTLVYDYNDKENDIHYRITYKKG